MAPAVSWKSSSCWRKRMACGTKTAWLNKLAVTCFHGDRVRTYVAGQLVDRSVLGHVVLLIWVILQSHKSHSADNPR